LTLGDDSHLGWAATPEWQKETVRHGVARALGGATAEEMHQSWLTEKRANGWKYSPIKDAEKKEHPYLLPYAELPAEQQKKDVLFAGVVRLMAQALGLQ